MTTRIECDDCGASAIGADCGRFVLVRGPGTDSVVEKDLCCRCLDIRVSREGATNSREVRVEPGRGAWWTLESEDGVTAQIGRAGLRGTRSLPLSQFRDWPLKGEFSSADVIARERLMGPP